MVTSSQISGRPLMRDAIFVELALETGKIPAEAIQRGRDILEEMGRFGISRCLSSLLVERKLIDRDKERDVLRDFQKLQVACPRCRKPVTLEGLVQKEHLRCSNCQCVLGVEFKPAPEGIPEGKLRLEDRLKSFAVQPGEPSREQTLLKGASSGKQPQPSARAWAIPGPAPEKGGPTSARPAEGAAPQARPGAREVIRLYRVEGALANGPHGRLHRARRAAAPEGEGEPVVLKVFSAHLLDHLRDTGPLRAELEKWGSLDPKFPQPPHSLEREEPLLYLVRPFVGPPFAALSEMCFAEPARRIQALLRIAAPLKAVHGAGRIHGNLKPSNVFLDPETGRVALVDPALHLLLPRERVARWKVLADAPSYRSPEEIDGEEPTARSDIYSLGWILYAVLAGAAPFAGAAPPEVLRRHRSGPCPELPAEAGEWRGLHLAMTARDPAQRPADAGALLSRMEEISSGKKPALAAVTPRPEGAAAQPASAGQKVRPFHWRYFLGPVVLAMILSWLGWCYLGWRGVRAVLSAESRSALLHNRVAEQAFKKTEREAAEEPERGRELWERYLQQFKSTSLQGAAEAKRADFPAPAPPHRQARPAPQPLPSNPWE
jgi:hypothetical protein